MSDDEINDPTPTVYWTEYDEEKDAHRFVIRQAGFEQAVYVGDETIRKALFDWRNRAIERFRREVERFTDKS